MATGDYYYELARRALIGDLDTIEADVKVALLDESHTPAPSTDEVWNDVSADEITNTGANDTGYTAGGQSLSNVSVSRSGSVTSFDADDVVWSNSTIEAGYAVVYDDTPASDSDKTLVLIIDFEGEESSFDDEFTIDWDAAGISDIDLDP